MGTVMGGGVSASEGGSGLCFLGSLLRRDYGPYASMPIAQILMLAVANAQLSCNCQHEHERNLRATHSNTHIDDVSCNLQPATRNCSCCGYQILRYTFRVCTPNLASILCLSQPGSEFSIFLRHHLGNQFLIAFPRLANGMELNLHLEQGQRWCNFHMKLRSFRS